MKIIRWPLKYCTAFCPVIPGETEEEKDIYIVNFSFFRYSLICVLNQISSFRFCLNIRAFEKESPKIN